MPLLAQSFFAALLIIVSVDAAADNRPNIVFIMSDDHAVKAVSAYGNAIMQTPNIDRLANEGMRFDRAYVGNAICGPSRATMLTGMHSHGNGFYSNEWSGPFDGTQQTLPNLLQANGYQTAVVGKWHLYSDPVGFDHWDVITNAFEQGTYFNPHFRSPAGTEEATGYVADLVTDKAIRWLGDAKGKDAPFFLIYNHKTPHRDWMPGPEELKNWDDTTTIAEPPSLLRDLDGLTDARRDARMTIRDWMTNNDVKLTQSKNFTPEQQALWEGAFAAGNRAFEEADLSGDEEVRWKYQRYIKTYIGSVTSMDRQIGRLLDFLETEGLTENTLVIYTSDQGFFLGENGWFDKRWIDEASARIPLLVRWPGQVEAASVHSGLVQNIDFAPTLLAAAGIKPAKPMHGISLVEHLQGKATEPRDLYYHFYENPGFHGVARHYGILTSTHKLAYYYENDEWELFERSSDPWDQVNLHGEPGTEALTADLKQRLAALRVQYAVPDEDPDVPWYHGIVIRLVEQLLKLM